MIHKPFGRLGWPGCVLSLGCRGIDSQWAELDNAMAGGSLLTSVGFASPLTYLLCEGRASG
jgi:hypothetical protein